MGKAFMILKSLMRASMTLRAFTEFYRSKVSYIHVNHINLSYLVTVVQLTLQLFMSCLVVHQSRNWGYSSRISLWVVV